ncbi:MAG: NADP-dependent phosphogluconate dehydrogenase [Ferruginibacter sp.]
MTNLQAYQVGMIGLGTMGCNLVLNMNDSGYRVAGYDKDISKIDILNKLATNDSLKAFSDIKDFAAALQTPRIIMLLVPAGKVVDYVINDLVPLLQPEDIIIDCGNSHFTDTAIRVETLSKLKLHFVGIGISGGETGARYGPSIMPGGDKEVYPLIAPILQAVAARVNDQPCTAYMGNGAAGHYVKMVHNGIEYALMQLISEAYHLLKIKAGYTNEQLHALFDGWNKGRLKAYLIEITAAIFLQKDENGKGYLLDNILDTAQQKGTGAWMSQDAMTIQSPIPSIDASVSQRMLSALKQERMIAAAANKLDQQPIQKNPIENLPALLEEALHAACMICYSQGMTMLRQGSIYYKFDIPIKDVAAIWRGGCIIRASMLEDIMQAYNNDEALNNLVMAPAFALPLRNALGALKEIVKTGVDNNIPLPAFSACLNYYLSYHSAWLPANLVQAQRDFFGAHTYERTDSEGTFHTIWNETIQ